MGLDLGHWRSGSGSGYVVWKWKWGWMCLVLIDWDGHGHGHGYGCGYIWGRGHSVLCVYCKVLIQINYLLDFLK